jgi:hypothetical protein
MKKIIRSIKSQFRYLRKLTPSLGSIKSNAQSSANLFTNGIASVKFFIRDARNSYKNLYENNMNLALFHQKNGNILDAKLRYAIAHLFNKNHPEPLLGLAEIAIQKKKNKKAVKYFTKALPLITNREHKKQIEYIIHEISI